MKLKFLFLLIYFIKSTNYTPYYFNSYLCACGLINRLSSLSESPDLERPYRKIIKFIKDPNIDYSLVESNGKLRLNKILKAEIGYRIGDSLYVFQHTSGAIEIYDSYLNIREIASKNGEVSVKISSSLQIFIYPNNMRSFVFNDLKGTSLTWNNVISLQYPRSSDENIYLENILEKRDLSGNIEFYYISDKEKEYDPINFKLFIHNWTQYFRHLDGNDKARSMSYYEIYNINFIDSKYLFEKLIN